MILAIPNPNDSTGDTIDIVERVGDHNYFMGSVHIDLFYATPLYEIHTKLSDGLAVPISISPDVTEIE